MWASKPVLKNTILDEIICKKGEEVSRAKAKLSFSDLERQIQNCSPLRNFCDSLRSVVSVHKAAVIAEIKRASPSKGVIRKDFNPAEHARDYERNGATCLSVLTDVNYFQGSDTYLQQAKAACSIPVLRKDFIVDPYQIAHSKLLGADCILLIVAALQHSQLLELAAYANEISMDILVEIHNREELERALEVESDLIGVNNRNLHNFETSFQTTLDLYPHIPPEKIIITESGINKVEDVDMMTSSGIFGFLVGESFMRASQPGSKLKELFFSRV